MCELLFAVDWLGLMQTIAVLFATWVAYMALNTWRHQAKANKQTDFLDQLTDAVHEYIQSLTRSVEFLKYIHIGFDSHRNPPTNIDHKHSHVVAYITAKGNRDAEKMWEFLSSSDTLVAKVQALVARGQVYGLDDYPKCANAVKKLLWQHQRLQVVASMIGSPNWNWENPEVTRGIDNMLSVTPEDIEKYLQRENVEFLEFARSNYRSIFNGT